MSDANDYERISRKAYEIWESEGHPHGRDQSHWDQAKEIVALHDSMGETLLPRDTGALEPEEPTEAVEPYGDVPGLTDQGRDDLVNTDREPEVTKPSHATYSQGDTAGHVARQPRDGSADIDEPETVTPAPKLAPVTPTPSNPMLGEPAPRPASTAPVEAPPAATVPKTADAPPKPVAPATGPGLEKAPIVTAGTLGRTPPPVPAGAPPIATPAGARPTALDDARRGSSLQAPPAGNSAPITGKAPPKPDPAPAPVTRGNPNGRR